MTATNMTTMTNNVTSVNSILAVFVMMTDDNGLPFMTTMAAANAHAALPKSVPTPMPITAPKPVTVEAPKMEPTVKPTPKTVPTPTTTPTDRDAIIAGLKAKGFSMKGHGNSKTETLAAKLSELNGTPIITPTTTAPTATATPKPAYKGKGKGNDDAAYVNVTGLSKILVRTKDGGPGSIIMEVYKVEEITNKNNELKVKVFAPKREQPATGVFAAGVMVGIEWCVNPACVIK